jgi:hypothetical protein
LDPKGIGLAIVDALNEEKTDSKPSKPERPDGSIWFPSQVQIPPPPSPLLSPAESPKYPADLVTKTSGSQLGGGGG